MSAPGLGRFKEEGDFMVYVPPVPSCGEGAMDDRAGVPLAVAQRLVRSAAVLTRAAPAAGLRVRGLSLVQDQRGTRLVVDYAPAEAS